MAFLRKFNWILLFLLFLTLCAILYNSVHKIPPAYLENQLITSQITKEKEIPIVICAPEERMGAAIAAINSVYTNTDSNILFYIVGLKRSVSHIRQWIKGSKLHDIRFKIVEFNPKVLKGKIRQEASRPELLQPLNFVRFYLPALIHGHEKVIYLDDDVIVQGDIEELYHMKLAQGHAAAFSEDCDVLSTKEVTERVGLQNTYMGFLDYNKQTVRGLKISPGTCTFNPGVMVANMTEWKNQHVTKQLEKWMKKNVIENLYSSTLADVVATPPMLIVFHKRYTAIDPLWHIRYLGWSPIIKYSDHLLHEAKLFHWNGRYKPWSRPCAYSELWEKWFIPDPSGSLKLNNPEKQ